MLAERQGEAQSRLPLVLLPAVDVLGDAAVRLEQGDYGRISTRAGDPAELVARFAADRPPWIHVVDLDAARSGSVRPSLIRRLAAAASKVPLQAAGGVRSPGDALALVEAGAGRVVIGTAAFRPPGPQPYVEALGERLVVAIDVRDGQVATNGWRISAGVSVDDAVDRCTDAGVARLLCTAVNRDGMLAGPDLELVASVVERSRLPVLAAGGVRSRHDLAALAEVGAEGAVVGRALLSSL